MDPAERPARVIAVDWSGAASGARERIWLAEARGEQLVRLECGRERDELVLHLIECAERAPALLVGLDFAFSFPAWFLREHGVASMPGAWELAVREGEHWLADCPPPFWGRHGRACPQLAEGCSPWRLTERELASVAGIRPKSVFQLGGAGAVGTGSLRGMPGLTRLRAAGFAVWPWDPPRFPLAVEIYPRCFTGPVHKSRRSEREVALASRPQGLAPDLRERAAGSEDAFDAALPALEMAGLASRAPSGMLAAEGEDARMEGWIWSPDP